MAGRKLTADEKRLWKLYTRDIKKTNAAVDGNDVLNEPAEYKIRIPTRSKFKPEQRAILSNHESLEKKDSNWGKKLAQGKVAIDGKIDLHGMTRMQAHEKLLTYLERAQFKGKRVLLVITGKGGPKSDYEKFAYGDFEDNKGALRREVPIWLSGGSMRHLILTFQEARQSDGGTGALYVVLKRKP